MCTLLVFAANDNTHADETKDLRGCWKRGMIVSVVDDGVCTESPSAGSKLAFVHITGLEVAQVKKYLEQTETRRRAYKIDWTTLPTTIKNSLRDNKEVTVTIAQVKKYIRNLITNDLEG